MPCFKWMRSNRNELTVWNYSIDVPRSRITSDRGVFLDMPSPSGRRRGGTEIIPCGPDLDHASVGKAEMNDRRKPTALTIAASDPTGGAGIQVDLQTFHHFGVSACSVITAVTAQNSVGVSGVWPLPAEAIQSQLASLL